MSKVAIEGNASGTGTLTIAAPNTNTNRTITLPDATGTLALAGGASDKIEEGDSKVEVTDAGTGKVEITVDAVEVADFTTGAIVFNETGANQDFRVEGDTDANLFVVDASADRVGIGTNAPTSKLHVAAASDPTITIQNTAESTMTLIAGGNGQIKSTTNLDVFTAGTLRARITSAGEFLVGTTSNNGKFTVSSPCNTVKTGLVVINTDADVGTLIQFVNSAGNQAGLISQTGTTTVNYGTSSDYRLKENVVPMTGALAKVLELNPVTYTWKVDGSAGEGFIAHELQAVCPDAVVGGKDATEVRQVEVSPAVPATYDEDGNELTPAVEAAYEERKVPKYQGVDTSFLVATLTAAIQELKAEVDQTKTRIEALENNNA